VAIDQLLLSHCCFLASPSTAMLPNSAAMAVDDAALLYCLGAASLSTVTLRSIA